MTSRKLELAFPSKHYIIDGLKSEIQYQQELENHMKSVNHSFEDLLNTEQSPQYKRLEIESIVDYVHDELNTGHWKDVPLKFRHVFTVASYLKAVMIVKTSTKLDRNSLTECLRCLDMGLLLGAPLEDNPELLTASASLITKTLDNFDITADTASGEIGSKKRKHNTDALDHFGKLKAQEIKILSCPSLEKFNKDHLVTQLPVKLCDCMGHWPAVTKWLDIQYLLKVAGDRTVPIEIGSHYADEDWSQKLMTVKEFMKRFYMDEDSSKNVGYLAQHNLFDQIPELRRDILIPEYCCLSSDDDPPDINAWFGPKGTVSPLHYDPKDNLLAQVFGTKQIVLFAPSDAPYLYAHENKLLENTAQVDPINPDLQKHEQFKKATMYKCLLEPGQMLYIPRKWWHHVTALEKSFSVSFWWS